MRLYLVLAMAILVLALAGCAKKKPDDSNATASNNQAADTNSDSEQPMDDPMNDEAMADPESEMPDMEEMMPEEPADIPEEPAEEPMPEEPAVEPMPEEPAEPPTEDPAALPEGDMPMPGETAGEDGRGVGTGGNPTKPTDIPNVKEDTAEYAAVDFLLKVGRGETEGLQDLIAEDVNGLLKQLRSDKPEKALEEAKELIGRWKPQNSRLADRETVVYFLNDKGKVLQLHVRRIQGEYVVRELRVHEAVNKTPRRRR